MTVAFIKCGVITWAVNNHETLNFPQLNGNIELEQKIIFFFCFSSKLYKIIVTNRKVYIEKNQPEKSYLKLTPS